MRENEKGTNRRERLGRGTLGKEETSSNDVAGQAEGRAVLPIEE